MNIIKLENIVCPEHIADPASRDLFNTKFRGMYCFAINMSKIYIMVDNSGLNKDGISIDNYIDYERGVNIDLNIPYLDYNQFECLIVENDTHAKKIPYNVDFYTRRNSLTSNIIDRGYDINRLRRFRMEVAGLLLSYKDYTDVRKCDKMSEMVSYYAEDMKNDTISNLTMFNDFYLSQLPLTLNSNNGGCSSCSTPAVTFPTQSCGCNSGVQISSINNITPTCNMLQTYRKIMKTYMISVFSDYNFWVRIADDAPVVVDTIKDMIKSLADSGLSIFYGDKKLDLNYRCSDASSHEYETFNKDLNDIATAFELILDKDLSRISFIKSSLNLFATYYEYLQWEGYIVNKFDIDENYD